MTDVEVQDIVAALAADPRTNYRYNKGEDHGDSFYAYIGKHVGVYQHQILGATRDVDLLREVLVERYQIAPERIVFVYID